MASSDEIVAAARSGAEAVYLAWTVPGPGVDIHAKAKEDLHSNWPTLAKSVERLVSEYMQYPDSVTDGVSYPESSGGEVV